MQTRSITGVNTRRLALNRITHMVYYISLCGTLHFPIQAVADCPTPVQACVTPEDLQYEIRKNIVQEPYF